MSSGRPDNKSNAAGAPNAASAAAVTSGGAAAANVATGPVGNAGVAANAGAGAAVPPPLTPAEIKAEKAAATALLEKQTAEIDKLNGLINNLNAVAGKHTNPINIVKNLAASQYRYTESSLAKDFHESRETLLANLSDPKHEASVETTLANLNRELQLHHAKLMLGDAKPDAWMAKWHDLFDQAKKDLKGKLTPDGEKQLKVMEKDHLSNLVAQYSKSLPEKTTTENLAVLQKHATHIKEAHGWANIAHDREVSTDRFAAKNANEKWKPFTDGVFQRDGSKYKILIDQTKDKDGKPLSNFSANFADDNDWKKFWITRDDKLSKAYSELLDAVTIQGGFPIIEITWDKQKTPVKKEHEITNLLHDMLILAKEAEKKSNPPIGVDLDPDLAKLVMNNKDHKKQYEELQKISRKCNQNYQAHKAHMAPKIKQAVATLSPEKLAQKENIHKLDHLQKNAESMKGSISKTPKELLDGDTQRIGTLKTTQQEINKELDRIIQEYKLATTPPENKALQADLKEQADKLTDLVESVCGARDNISARLQTDAKANPTNPISRQGLDDIATLNNDLRDIAIKIEDSDLVSKMKISVPIVEPAAAAIPSVPAQSPGGSSLST
jgi:hypothetical protein